MSSTGIAFNWWKPYTLYFNTYKMCAIIGFAAFRILFNCLLRCWTSLATIWCSLIFLCQFLQCIFCHTHMTPCINSIRFSDLQVLTLVWSRFTCWFSLFVAMSALIFYNTSPLHMLACYYFSVQFWQCISKWSWSFRISTK